MPDSSLESTGNCAAAAGLFSALLPSGPLFLGVVSPLVLGVVGSLVLGVVGTLSPFRGPSRKIAAERPNDQSLRPAVHIAVHIESVSASSKCAQTHSKRRKCTRSPS